MPTSKRERKDKSCSAADLVDLHDRSFLDWSESEHGFYVDRYYDAVAQRWVEGVYGPIQWDDRQRTLLRWAFTLNDQGMLPAMEGWVIDIGQSWKSTLAAALGQWFGDNPKLAINSELLFFANSREQSSGRAFKAMLNSLAWNPHGAEIGEWDGHKMLFYRTGNLAKPVVTSAGSIAGAPSIYRNIDEAWDYEGERDDTLIAEAKPTPTRNVSFMLVTTYVPFADSEGPVNKMLSTIFQEGVLREDVLTGAQIDPSLAGLPVYLDPVAGVWLWWNHDPYPWHLRRQPNGRTYLDNQMNRPGVSKAQGRRIWCAELVQRDNAFMPMDQWDKCEHPDLFPLDPRVDRKVPIVATVDIGIYGDHCFGTARSWNPVSQTKDLRAHKHTQPSDYEGRDRRDAVQDMKEWLWKLHQEQNLLAAGYDPSQFEAPAQELMRQGVNMVRITQNDVRTQADTDYRNDILGLRLRNYAGAADLRQHVLNAMAREIGNGSIRLVKSKGAKKIDGAVADSMTCWLVRQEQARFEQLARQPHTAPKLTRRVDPVLRHFRLGRG